MPRRRRRAQNRSRRAFGAEDCQSRGKARRPSRLQRLLQRTLIPTGSFDLCPAAINGDVARRNGVIESNREGFVFCLAHTENSGPPVLAKLPIIEAFGLAAVAALGLHL